MPTLQTCIYEFDLKHRTATELSVEDVLQLDLFHTDKVYWIHSNLQQSDLHAALIKACHIKEEVFELEMLPIVSDSEDSLTLQIQCPLSTDLNRKTTLQSGSLILYLTDTFCFTASSDDIPALHEFITQASKSLRFGKTPCFILFLILDAVVNDFAKVLFNFDMMSEQMDLRVRKTHRNIHKEVITLKQQLMKVKRNIIALREILLRISSRNISVISEDCRASLGRLANHTDLVIHEVDSVREILNGLLEQIENNMMQTLNQSMRFLTGLSTIFLPLTLIAGIYGMNFQWMPELSWRYGYFFALSLMVLCAGIILYIFKRMKWF